MCNHPKTERRGRLAIVCVVCGALLGSDVLAPTYFDLLFHNLPLGAYLEPQEDRAPPDDMPEHGGPAWPAQLRAQITTTSLSNSTFYTLVPYSTG